MKLCRAIKVALTLCMISNLALAQEWAVANISEDLREDVNYVIRNDEVYFEVLSPGKGVLKTTNIITLLNSKAKKQAFVTVYYDKLRSVGKLKVLVFDKNGNEIDRVNKNDFMDAAQFDGFSLYSDNRLLYHDFSKYDYPFTLQIEYEHNLDGLMFYPSNYFRSPEASVEQSVFTVVMPGDMELRYRTHMMPEPKLSMVSGGKKYYWEMKNKRPIKREPFGPSYEELIPHVLLSPRQFEIEGYTGDMSTWEDFGVFQNKLFEGLDDIPSATVAKIRGLTQELTDDKEKIRIVYEYLQENFRYVSIQLGIGGWRPFSPAYVSQYGYGDCKALTYYTKTLLDRIGITSHYTLISAGGKRPLFDDFATSRFNHVILTVPNKGDTVWLECTSQTAPMGYMGTFTGDRQALMITERGGQLIKTPTYRAADNQATRVAHVRIDDEGNASVQSTTDYEGLRYEKDGLSFVLNDGQEQQKDWLYDNVDIPNFSISDFALVQPDRHSARARISLDLEVKNIGSRGGSRLFFEPNLMNKVKNIPDDLEERETDVILSMSYEDTDTIYYYFPTGMYPEVVPQAVQVETSFGEYHSEVHHDADKIMYVRRLKVNSGRYAKEVYNELYEFYNTVSKADRSKMVLKSST